MLAESRLRSAWHMRKAANLCYTAVANDDETKGMQRRTGPKRVGAE
jgi:hypothetical protein